LLILTGAAFLIFGGCSSPEDPNFTTYDEELKRFITDSEAGRELFATDLYSSDPFTFDTSSGMYYYEVDSVTRKFKQILIAKTPKNIHRHFNNIYDARVELVDAIFGKTYHIDDDTSFAYRFIDSLTRYAYFVKLYNDNYAYHGWFFWAFSGGRYNRYAAAPRRAFESERGIEFSGGRPNLEIPNPLKDYRSMIIDTLINSDPPVIDTFYTFPNLVLIDTITQDTNYYLLIHGHMPQLRPGDSLTYEGVEGDRMFARTADNTVKSFTTSYIQNKYRAGWHIPNSNERINHLILFDVSEGTFIPTVSPDDPLVTELTHVKKDNYVIPYLIR
jgi:hypothetical protein